MPRLATVSTCRQPRSEAKVLLDKIGKGRTNRTYRADQVIFAEGDTADTVCYIESGNVKLSVHSEQGKEAIVGLPGPDEFFGEACVSGHACRHVTAVALTEARIVRVKKSVMLRLINDDPAFSELFIARLLERSVRVEADLVDQLFNSSEMRLARTLLLLANFDKEGRPETIIKQISQGTLAEMVGTTRSRVSHFMNKFRKLGFIDYRPKSNEGGRFRCQNGVGGRERERTFEPSGSIDSRSGIRVYPSLLNFVLNDQPQIIRDNLEAPEADWVESRRHSELN